MSGYISAGSLLLSDACKGDDPARGIAHFGMPCLTLQGHLALCPAKSPCIFYFLALSYQLK